MQALESARQSPLAAGHPTAGAAARGAVRIAAFFGLIVALAFMLDGLLGLSLRRLTTGDFGEWNRIVHGQVNADILISGSSRALTHYDPRILEAATGRSTYNIGLNGSQTDMQLARLKTYLRNNRKPQLLIHNLDAFTFQLSHGEVYDPGQYVPYLDEPDLYVALSRINVDAWKVRHIPLYGYAAQDLRLGWLQGLHHWIKPETRPTHHKGFKPRETPWTGEFDQFRARHPNGLPIDIDPQGVAKLEELLRVCASEGIQVVLSYSPEYSEMQAMTTNRAEIFARFEALSRQYGATFLDFSQSPISLRKELFYNSQHLNADGAAEFTRELAARLKLPAAQPSATGSTQ